MYYYYIYYINIVWVTNLKLGQCSNSSMSSAVWRLLWAIWRDFNTGKHPAVYTHTHIIGHVLTTITIILMTN